MIEDTDLLTILKESGLRTDRVGKMYFSPWNQDESTPSMHISVTSGGRQVWSCFGPVPDRVTRLLESLSGKKKKTAGGGTLDLIAAIHGLHSYAEAIRWLEDRSGRIRIDVHPSVAERKDRADGPAFVIDRVQDGITAKYLTSYLDERKVSLKAASFHCQQLTYHLRRSPRTSYVGIGFANNGGGYAIRSRLYKWSTGSDVTTIDRMGSRSLKASTPDVLVFEGFINFLSWLTVCRKTAPGVDICVLNSVNNVSRALGYLSLHGTVRCILDNDKAGRDCLETIRRNGGDVIDESPLYEGYNDINDWLMAGGNDSKK